ncbi:hypothetical protein [Mesorhizobium sp. B1-1-8]|uniref:hypothetical protein n=1 Tax=Mesorhizobium sp. B1-1-8 TaxID=2589976 RepID=UPI00112ED1A7|nr:hypothetical protein [Mesorhizobium sp. B1-1-8]UCI07322.1 hypothetical protein FJ974_26650 [Mesorhizobium sp. B1-1-8]
MGSELPWKVGARRKAEDKLFPDGIEATFLAIQNYWLNLKMKKPERMSALQFTKAGFRRVFKAVVAKYGAVVDPGDVDDDDSIKRVLQRLCSQNRALEFYHLRSFAEFVELPTGMLLLFSQMVSDERRMLDDGFSLEQTNDFLIDFITSTEHAVKAARQLLEERGKFDRVFTFAYDKKGHKQMARAKTLLAWSEAFNAGPYPAHKAKIWPAETITLPWHKS